MWEPNLTRLRGEVLESADAVCKIAFLPDCVDAVCNFCQQTAFWNNWPERAEPGAVAQAFPLPWSAYVRLLSVKTVAARAFYESEALREGWSVRQLDRQIGSQLYERLALSRNKAALLRKAADVQPGDLLTPEEALNGAARIRAPEPAPSQRPACRGDGGALVPEWTSVTL
jgi:hypothetical protein